MRNGNGLIAILGEGIWSEKFYRAAPGIFFFISLLVQNKKSVTGSVWD